MTSLEIYKKIIDENGKIIYRKPIKINLGMYVTFVSTSDEVLVRLDTNYDVYETSIIIPKAYRELKGADKDCFKSVYIAEEVARDLHRYDTISQQYSHSNDNSESDGSDTKVYDNEAVEDHDSAELIKRINWMIELFARDSASKKEKKKKA